MAFSFGPIIYKVTTEGLKEGQAAAQSINQNMAGAAAAASKLGKSATAALNQTAKGTFGESVAYGQARGATGQTGASARDFANQAQGLGGLVRLYATFAANIFAVGAAFEALKRSFQFEQLQRASDAFAVSTGKNLSGVALELKKLSEGTLTDKAAQQIANYGTSAGFTSDQMRRIIVVAKGASQALGRDMGDAIDRLMRGAGKLNPELLDELGLLTRTKAAYAEYGKAVGKSANDLTGFEKTQAFTNAVLKEGEEKFGAVAKVISASPFEKFTASLLSMGTSLGNIFNKVFVPILDFFSNNPTALIAAMTAAFGKLLLTALPALNNLGEGAKKAAETQAAALKEMRGRAEEAAIGIANTKDTQRALDIGNYQARIKGLKDYIAEETTLQKQAAENYLKEATSRNKLILKIANDGQISLKQLNSSLAQPKLNTNDRVFLEGYKANLEDIKKSQESLANYKEKLVAAEKAVLNSANDNIVVQSKLNSILERRLQIASVKSSGLAAVTETAQIGTLRQSFEHLGVVMDNVRAAHQNLGSQMGIMGRTLTNLSVISTGVVGTFKIMTASISTLLNVLSPWLLALGLVVAAFEGIVSITGGVSKKLEETQTAQENFVKALSLTGEQVVHFEKLQKTVDGSAESFLKIASYSTNMFTGILDGLSATTKAFAAFASDSSGWWSGIKEGLKDLFGMDTTISTQVKQLRSSIFTVLASVSPQDQKKVEQAVVSALPSATSLEQVFAQLGKLSSAQLATFGTNLTNNLAMVNTALKYNEENLKASIQTWKSLGDAVDKYNEKQIAKDPKLKDIVQDLHSINLAYKAAKTEKDKALVLSGLDVEVQDKLVKLAKDRGVNLQAWSHLIDEARAKSKAYAEEEQAAADAKKKKQDETAISYITDQKTFQDNLKEIGELQLKIAKNDYTPGVGNKQKFDDITRVEQLKASTDKLLAGATEAAEKANDQISKASLQGFTSGFDLSIDNWLKNAKDRASIAANAVLGIIKSVFTPEESTKLLNKTLNPLANYPTLDVRDQAREARVQASGGLGRAVSTFDKNKKILTDAEKALAALKPVKEAHEKIAKSYEFEIQKAVALEAQIKRIADIEKETVGFIDEQTASQQEAASAARANLELTKRLQEVRIEYNKALEDKNPDAAKNLQNAVKAAVATRDIALQNSELETLRSRLLRDKIQFEKLYVDLMKEQFSVSQQISDLESQSGLISESNYNLHKAENVLAQTNLDLAIKQQSLDSRKEINAAKGPPTAAQSAIFEAEQKILDIEKSRAVITKQITDEQAKQKEFWDQVVEVNSTIANSLSIQLKYSSQLVSYANTLSKATKAENLTALEIGKSYRGRVSALGLQVDSEEEIILREQSILELTDKIYQQRVQMYQLAAKDGSGANFLETLGKGFAIEAENFKQAMKSAVQTVVDGTLAAIDAPINYIVETLKGGGKLNASAMMKTIADSIKGSLFEYAGNTVKNFARQMLSSLFGANDLSLQQVTKEAAQKFEETNKVITVLNNQFDPLIAALHSLENAIQNAIPKTANEVAFAGNNVNLNQSSYDIGLSNSTKVLDNFDSSVQSGMDSVGNFGEQLGRVAEGTGRGFSSIIDFIARRAQSISGSAGSTIGSVVGSALGNNLVGNMAGSLATSAAGSAITGGLSAAWTTGSLYYAGVSAAGPVIAGDLVASIGAGLAEVPVAGWVALGALVIAGIISGLDDGPAMRSGTWRSSTTPASSGAPLGRGNSLFQGTSAFGAFGVTDDKWFSDKDMGEAVKNFINNITTIDNAISNAVGPDVTEKISTNLAAVTTNFEAGMEHEGVTFGSILLERYKVVLNTVSEGFGSLLDGFDGTGQELASFVLGLISMSKVMSDATQMTQLFGESFSLDALKEQQKAGELITDTFNRLSQEFSITNQVVDAMGVSVVDVFGAVGLAGTKMRENLIAATGGIDALTTKVNFYLDNFFTDTEKKARSLAKANIDVTTKFGTDAPKTRQEYNTAVTKALIDGNFDLYNSLLTLGPAFDTIYDAVELLIDNTNKLNDSLNEFNLTFGQDFAAALDAAGISIDTFISDVTNLATSMLTPEQLGTYAVDNANKKIDNSGTGYLATTGQSSIPKSREELWNQFFNENDPVLKAKIASFWKSFDVIFDAIDDSTKKEEEAQKSLADNIKLVGDAASLAGMSFSDDLVKSLESVDGAAKELADNLKFFADQFLTDAEKTAYSTSSATKQIADAGLIIPKTRTDFVKWINTLSESQKLVVFKLLPAYDALYDAEDARAKQIDEETKAIAEKIKSATGILFSETEQKALTFKDASETVNAAFEKLGKAVPTTVEGFREIYNSLDDAGKLALLEVVPAFGTLMDTIVATADAVKKAVSAMEEALSSIRTSTGSFIDEIQDSIGTAEQRYNKYKTRSEENSKQIDEINRLSDEQITEKVRTGDLTPEKIAQISNDAVENAKKAWGQLTDEQKQILGPAFETYIEQLEKNATDVVKRVGDIAAKIAGEPLPTTTALTTPAPASGTATTTDSGTTVATAITEGGTTAANSIQTSMTSGSATIVSNMESASIVAGNNLSAGVQMGANISAQTLSAGVQFGANIGAQTLSAGVQAGSLIAAKNLEEVFTRVMQNISEVAETSQNSKNAIGDQIAATMQNNANKQAQVVDQQQSSMAAFTAQLLEAAKGMLSAAAGQQEAANTPQQINVNVDLSGLPTNTGNEVTG